MGWETSDRHSRLPADWQTRRLAVLRRCGFRCEFEDDGVRCASRATEVDHVQRGDDHSLANLQGACSPHHTAKTQSEALAARMARRYRPREPHPSLHRH